MYLQVPEPMAEDNAASSSISTPHITHAPYPHNLRFHTVDTLPCVPECSPVSNSLLSLPVLAHTHADLLHHTLSPPPGSLAPRQDLRGESFVFGIDFTIFLAHPRTTTSVTSDGDMQWGSHSDPSRSVLHTVAIDAHTPVGSVVNSAPPPALSFDHGRAGIG